MAARVARTELLYEACFVHVISRSIRKIKIFRDSEDFKAFRELLRAVKHESGLRIFHYCFMHTHFHFAMQISTVEQLVRAMQKLKSRYAMQFHACYKVSGPIWRDRFRSLLIENEAYLSACGRYIEQNPVRAGLVRQASAWPHSSACHYQKNCHDDLLDDYDFNAVSGYSDDVDINDESMFEEKLGIGSGYFQYQLRERLKADRKPSRDDP